MDVVFYHFRNLASNVNKNNEIRFTAKIDWEVSRAVTIDLYSKTKSQDLPHACCPPITSVCSQEKCSEI